jgi:hypothetical protein
MMKLIPPAWLILALVAQPSPARAAPATGRSPTAPATRPVITDVDLDRHADALRRKTGDAFTIVIERPFIVIGDESPDMVRRRARDTVGWAVRMLRQAYFQQDPVDILEVWLLKDDASYRRHARDLFDDEPSTPFGYYSAQHKALIMNIATGGGTLVHEIVHPFIEANFPGCPAWFNEGLGSLYEQSAERQGQIVGLTNWRLDGLQRAIRNDELMTFAKLTATTAEQFYDDPRGTHYAQARYLCYYLQEKGLLRRFYETFAAKRAADPTGYASLKQVLGNPDMSEFQHQWESFVLSLHFP